MPSAWERYMKRAAAQLSRACAETAANMSGGKNGEALEEITARLDAAAAAMKERRDKLRELEHKFRRKEEE